jgi:F420H(2)-dependent quinone reductase
MTVSPLMRKAFRAVTLAHVWIYRVTDGRVGGHYRLGAGRHRPAPVLLLEHRGRRSGKQYITPLIYARDGERRVIVASQGGHPTNPNWYHNLKANPDTHIRVGRSRIPVHARVADDEERGRLWPKVVEVFADYADYQDRTSRIIPLVIL